MPDTALSGAKLRTDRANRDARCPIGGKGIDAGRYRRKGNRGETVRRRKIKRGAITGREQLLLPSAASSPDRADGMDDMPRRQAIAASDFCQTGFAAAKRSAFGQEVRSGSAVNGAVYPAAAKQGPVGGVDDGIGGERCDVGDADVKPRRTDRGSGKRRDVGDCRRHEPSLSRPFGLRFGAQIDCTLHADIVKVLVEETPRRALAADAKHVEEVVIGRQSAKCVEMRAEAVEHDTMYVDAAILARPDTARQPAMIDQARRSRSRDIRQEATS